MENYKRLQEANISLCVEIIDALWHHYKKGKVFTLDQLVQFVGKTKTYVQRATSLLELLEILVEDNNKYVLNEKTEGKIDGTPEKTLHLIRSRIIRLKPFSEYCTFLSSGKKSLDSAKLICSIYAIAKPHSVVEKLFSKWISQFEIDIKFEDGKLNIEALNNEFTNETTIINFLVEVLAEDYKYLNDKSREDFISALTVYKNNPKQAVNDIGRALEDFLRIDIAGSADVSGCSGIIQIAGILKSNNVITAKHNGILQALGNIRTMGDAHGIDKNLLERWVIRPVSALIYCKDVLIFMKSTLAYKLRQELIY